jgi:hypothetical protein
LQTAGEDEMRLAASSALPIPRQANAELLFFQYVMAVLAKPFAG